MRKSRFSEEQIIAVLSTAAAHHRLLWIHPFLDGNGRVARLISYAVLREALDTGGISSVARGLARSEAAYKAHLIACDLPRRIVSALVERSVLVSESSRASLRLAFPAVLAGRWMPGLFPDK